MLRDRVPAALDAAVEQQPRLDPRRARDERLQRALELVASDFREKAEMAEIDAEQRHVRARMRDGARRIEQRAVAAERDDHVDLSGDFRPRRGRPARAERCGRAALTRQRPAPHYVAPLSADNAPGKRQPATKANAAGVIQEGRQRSQATGLADCRRHSGHSTTQGALQSTSRPRA